MDKKEVTDLFKAAVKRADDIDAKWKSDHIKMSPEDRTAYHKAIEEGEVLKGQLQGMQKADDLKAWGAESAGMPPLTADGRQMGDGTVEAFYPAGTTYVERGKDQNLSVLYEEGEFANLDDKTVKAVSTKEYRMAYRDYLRKGSQKMSGNGLKVLQEGVDTSGGFLVPPDMLNRIISKAPAPTRMAGKVTRLTTGRDRLLVPKVNYATDDIYTTGIRVNWTGEVPASSTTHRVTEPVFGQIGIDVHTAMLSMPVTRDMIEDAAFPLVEWASGKFRETIDLLFEDMILNGSGIGRPSGILLNPGGANQPAVVNSGDANLLKPDGIIALGFALPEQYDSGAAFVFNKTSTGKAIAQLKDADNRYLWGYGLQDSGLSVPALRNRQLLGYECVLSALMPNVAANAFPILFGDFGGYYLVDRVAFSIEVLRELYAETNQILLLGRLRFGGQVVEPWKIYAQKVAA